MCAAESTRGIMVSYMAGLLATKSIASPVDLLGALSQFIHQDTQRHSSGYGLDNLGKSITPLHLHGLLQEYFFSLFKRSYEPSGAAADPKDWQKMSYLFTGLAVDLLGLLPNIAIENFIYDMFQRTSIKFSTLISKVLASCITYPFEVWKTR